MEGKPDIEPRDTGCRNRPQIAGGPDSRRRIQRHHDVRVVLPNGNEIRDEQGCRITATSHTVNCGVPSNREILSRENAGRYQDNVMSGFTPRRPTDGMPIGQVSLIFFIVRPLPNSEFI